MPDILVNDELLWSSSIIFVVDLCTMHLKIRVVRCSAHGCFFCETTVDVNFDLRVVESGRRLQQPPSNSKSPINAYERHQLMLLHTPFPPITANKLVLIDIGILNEKLYMTSWRKYQLISQPNRIPHASLVPRPSQLKTCVYHTEGLETRLATWSLLCTLQPIYQAINNNNHHILAS